jgi:hypothetical protein
MPNYPYILFNKSPEQLRRLGARGGKAYGRNQRVRRAQMPTPPAAGALPAAPAETAAEAIAVLDTQFPWLRGAEKSQVHESNLAAPKRFGISCAPARIWRHAWFIEISGPRERLP